MSELCGVAVLGSEGVGWDADGGIREYALNGE